MLQKQTKFLRGLALGAGAYSAAAMGLMAWPVSGYLAAALAGMYLLRAGKVRLWSHGTARWATRRDVLQMIGATSGLYLGRMGKDLIRLPQACHIAVFGPTGAGKGVSFIIPFLLTCEESCVVVDYKNELHDITAKFLKELGHEIVHLAPFGDKSDTYSPLDLIDKDSPHALDDCRELANVIVVRTGEEKDPHFNDSAEIVLTAIIAAVVAHGTGEMRTLNMVREILSDPQKLENTIKLMRESECWGGALRPLGGQLFQFQGEEKASVYSTALRHVSFLSSPAVMKNVATSSFDARGLRLRKMAIFLTIPPDRAAAQTGLFRIWLWSFIRTCMRQGLSRPGLGNVHYVIDEAALALGGRMDCIESALGIGRGSGIRLQFYFQSQGQLHRCFPQGQEQTLLSNCSQIYFAVNDNQTAEEVSKRLGDQTIIVEDGGSGTSTQYGHSSGRDSTTSSNRSSSTNRNWKATQRRLLQPSEVLTLSQRLAIIFTRGLPPIQTWLLRYYEENWLTKRSRFREKLNDFAKFLRAAAACVFLLWVAAFVTPATIRYLHQLMGR